MARYHVYIPEVYIARYTVEADSIVEARLKGYDAIEECDHDEEYFVYSHTVPHNECHWDVEKATGLASTKGLKDVDTQGKEQARKECDSEPRG